MKHADDIDEDYAARTFSPADGWAIVRHVLARLADTFGARETLARAHALTTRTVRTVLTDWLRPAEQLARKLLFVMARGLDVAPARVAITAGPAPPTACKTVANRDDPTTWRVSFRLCPASPRLHTQGSSQDWRPRTPVDRDLQWRLIDRYYEAEARARRANAAPSMMPAAQFTHRADYDGDARDAARKAWRRPQNQDGFSLAQRIEALLRVAADPHARALKLARRLKRATHDTGARLRAAFATPHDRYRSGRCPAGLALVDRRIRWMPRCDTS